MRMALDEALVAIGAGEVPVGCVIVQNDLVIACAHNQRESKHDPTAHAEIIALREAGNKSGGWRLDGATVYVTLEPCPMCAAAILMARVARIVYAVDDPRLGAFGSMLDLPHELAHVAKPRITRGVLQDEAAKLLTDFFRQRRM